LAEYYGAEGSDDAVLVELPKGSYHLEFRHRSPAAKANSTNAPETARAEVLPQSRRETWKIVAITFAVLFAASLVALFSVLPMRRSPALASTQGDSAPVPEAFRIFWKPFLSGPDEPRVIFSNAAFVGRPEVGLRYFNPVRDSKDLVFDHYTGVGEVLAVHDLDHVFELLHQPIRVKRGSLFSLDDAQNSDMIFVGSPSENLTLTEIPGTKDFVFQRLTSGPRGGDLAIVNAHPEPNEPKSVLASPSNSPLTEDYGVVALLPGLNAGR
jgi:hypothetical protein